MKIILINLCIALTCFSLVLDKERLKVGAKTDILGESNSEGTLTKGAITYALGGTGGYILKDDTGYVKPTLTDHLPGKTDLPPPGPQEVVEELPSVTDYYDGSFNLNSVKIQCKLYANPTDCVHQSTCGWCGSSRSCILGNNQGPLQPCLKSSYVFSLPYPKWSPETKIVTEPVGGVSLSVASS